MRDKLFAIVGAGFKLSIMTLFLAVLRNASAQSPGGLPANYIEFDSFCKENFGAEIEPLLYDKFGSQLRLASSGEWAHISERSAAISFETNLPAISRIQYGLSSAYGQTTDIEPSSRYYYLHLHHLKDLTPNTTYHYRFVATDERGNKVLSENKTFRTKNLSEAIRIPGNLNGPPFILDQAYATYLATEDISAAGTAFELRADGITLDLGGRRVVYNSTASGVPGDGNMWDYIRNSSFGVNVIGASGYKILNGTIEQGAGNDAAHATSSIGYNPMYLKGDDYEVAGTRVIYSGAQQVGMYGHWGGSRSELHHNVLEDRGNVVLYRHGAGSRAILFYGSDSALLEEIKIHHNLIKRSRHMGVTGHLVYANEIYIDSWDVNAFSVNSWQEAYNNKVFGTGSHISAFSWGAYNKENRLKIYDNLVHFQGTTPSLRSSEVGNRCILGVMRLTQYSGSETVRENYEYYNNLIVLKGRGGSELRGTQFFSDPFIKNLRFYNNTVKVISEDQETTQAAAVVTQGNRSRHGTELPVFYENNRFISNICQIRFGDSYGTGWNHHFYRNHFIREGDRADYGIFCGGSGYPSQNHVVRDPNFSGGADIDLVRWRTTTESFTVEWTLFLRTNPGVTVEIKDLNDTEVFSGTSDPNGAVAIPLKQFLSQHAGKTFFTPHTVTVSLDDKSASKEVVMDQRKAIELLIPGLPPPPKNPPAPPSNLRIISPH